MGWPLLVRSITLTHLFNGSPSAKEIVCNYAAKTVWLLGRNYRKKYCLPLLRIVGVSSMNNTFTLAYCFLQAERKNSYLWAMRKLQQIFLRDGHYSRNFWPWSRACSHERSWRCVSGCKWVSLPLARLENIFANHKKVLCHQRYLGGLHPSLEHFSCP